MKLTCHTLYLFRCFPVSILKRFTACDSTSSITGITCAFVKYAYRNIASVSVWLYAGAKNKCQIHFFGFDFFIAKNYNIGFSVKPMMCMEKMWPHAALSVWMLSGKIDVSIYHKEYLACLLERVVFSPELDRFGFGSNGLKLNYSYANLLGLFTPLTPFAR